MGKNNFSSSKLEVWLELIKKSWEITEEGILGLYINLLPKNFKCTLCIGDVERHFSEEERNRYNDILKNYDPKLEKVVAEEMTEKLRERFESILQEVSTIDGRKLRIKSCNEMMMLYDGAGNIAFEKMKFLPDVGF